MENRFGPIEHITFRPTYKEALITFQHRDDADLAQYANLFIRHKRVNVHLSPYYQHYQHLHRRDESEDIDYEHLRPENVLTFDNQSITTIRNILSNFGHFITKLHFQGIVADYLEINYMFDCIHFYCPNTYLLILENMRIPCTYLLEWKLKLFFKDLIHLEVRNCIIGYDNMCTGAFPPNTLRTLKLQMARNYDFFDKVILKTYPQLTHFETDLKHRTAGEVACFLLRHWEQLKILKLNRFNTSWYNVPVDHLLSLKELWFMNSVCSRMDLIQIGKKLRSLKVLNFYRTNVVYDGGALDEINNERQVINAAKVEITNHRYEDEDSASDDALLYDYNGSHVSWFTTD